MKKTKTPGIVTIATLTLITLIFWIFFNVYRVFSVKTPVTVPEEILSPIDPSLDANALTNLTKRLYFEEGIIPDNNIPTQTATPAPRTPTPTESSSPTPSPTGVPSPTP
ncbi:hypothetical protein A2W13_01510 [Candidatus Woesebacteria bacterium RBG_16_36_11]|uniref:Uncharacterized protein n=3 Tax=Candidatus Woeseibacteriota TaxID=1752722 RepID=A0A1F7XBB0_9BACT|nr:MAG: hypothetical protein A2Z67_03520 [Candidatus Woesebacteria bacterium RBG_13_36_22]OGM12302.1 MAG: hypothetical protein A2W13_01510 [Candidatus Woesebacteria bacterium RBG_16_36_11]OGM16281.1 MAG: hypothetical protein A2V55_02605 [Candidatus Woesebacteria bacterium RBG_19FT_COMBO_37_29]